MLFLPAIYAGLIIAVAWATVWHATHDASTMSNARSSGEMKGAALAYFLPLFLGGVLFLLLIKPIFSRRRDTDHTLTLSRSEQPGLFEFVDRLARHVGAPSPTQIEVDCAVNASARFRRGVLSAIGGRDLVLRIGLPLATNLSQQQLAGVLAHEFGHFAQRGGMALTYLIRSTNAWFARVVYERDKIDAGLVTLSRDGGFWAVLLAANLARFVVWLTRRILWCLMMAGHAIASLMLRQMEFDADRYEARVAGSTAFERTSRALTTINIATSVAYDSIRTTWTERRLPDNFPELIAVHHRQLPAEIGPKLDKSIAERKTGWLDTHPCDRERIDAARQLNTSGIFHEDSSDTALFANFDDLAKRVTLAHYFELLGNEVKPENLTPVEGVVQEAKAQADNFTSMARFMQNTIHPLALAGPHRLPAPPAGKTATDAACDRLLKLRERLRTLAGPGRAAILSAIRATDRVDNVNAIRALRFAGISKVNAKAFDMRKADDAELAAVADAASKALAAGKAAIDDAQAVAIERLELALSLESLTTKPALDAIPIDAPIKPEDDFSEYGIVDKPSPNSTESLVSLMAQLDLARPMLRELLSDNPRLLVLLRQLNPGQNPRLLIEAILSRGKKLRETLERIVQHLPDVPYPYSHTRKETTVRQFIANHTIVPPADDPIQVFEFGGMVISRFFDFYGRVLSDLVHRAEDVESHLGLPQLDAPPDEEAPKEEAAAKQATAST